MLQIKIDKPNINLRIIATTSEKERPSRPNKQTKGWINVGTRALGLAVNEGIIRKNDRTVGGGGGSEEGL